MGFLSDIFGKEKLSGTDKVSNEFKQKGSFIGSGLADVLGGQFGGIDEGLGFARDLLGQKGALDPRIENDLFRDIEQERQLGQQSLDQAAAQAGLSGTTGALAVGSNLNQAASGRRADTKRQLAGEQANRFRGDLDNILKGLFINPATQLAGISSGVPTALKGPSLFERTIAPLAGGVVGSLAGGGVFNKKERG